MVEVRNAFSSLLDDLGDDPRHGRGAEDLLGLALELRLGQADGHDRGEAGEDVVLVDRVVVDLEQLASPRSCSLMTLTQRPLEAGDVRAALGRGDDVDEGLHRRCRSRCPSAARCRRRARAATSVGGHVPVLVEHRHGLVEVARPAEPQRVGDAGCRAPGSRRTREMPPS